MQQQGISIKRWQKPFSDIQPQNSPVTVLQVSGYPRETILDSQEREWVEKGNTLVILGAGARVTEAEFSTMQKSPQGNIKIDTRRRYKKANSKQVDLGDRFGAADTTDFVVEMVGKQEQLQLQKALGLGQVLLEPQALINFWIEKTGASAAELDTVLKLQSRKQSISERDLLSWLGKWRNIRGIHNL